MRATRFLIAIAGWLFIGAACGRTPSQPSPQPVQGQTSPTSVVTSVRVSGPARVGPGETARYTATADYSDGSSKDVTATAAWSPPSDRTWLPIYFTGAGIAQGANRGETNVAAAFGGKGGSLRVLVLDAGTFRLSGVVSESSGRLIPDATVDVVSGLGTGLRARTNQQGQYVLYGVAGPVQLRVSAFGLAPLVREVVVTSDGQTDAFALTPVDAPFDISGVWTMTLAPSPSCRSGLPDIAKGRTYQVQFIQQGSGLKLRTSSPTLEVYNPDENYGTIFGSRVRFVFIGDTNYGDWSSADLIDHLSPTETLGFTGWVQGTVIGSEIRATMDGDLVYFDTSLPATSPWKPTWYCRMTDHVITLRR